MSRRTSKQRHAARRRERVVIRAKFDAALRWAWSRRVVEEWTYSNNPMLQMAQELAKEIRP